MEKEKTEKGNAESQNHELERQIQDFNHEHPLNYYEVIEKRENLLCKVCNLEIYGEAYGCESCGYYLHKTCAKLPDEVRHPLHPQHPLILVPRSGLFLCLECREVSVGFAYMCLLCNFTLDVKCATITRPNNESQRRKETGRESKLCPFRQDHELVFYNLRQPQECRCSICLLLLSGPSYGCMHCKYFLHESCLGFPREIDLPLIHPEHTLHPILNKNPDVCCLICGFTFPKNSIPYNCEQCQFLHLHLSCANSLRRVLLSKAHKHPLFYFGTECLKLLANLSPLLEKDNFFKCNKCNKSFSGVPFYSCLFCRLFFHLECILIPHPIKSKCHIHPLTLRDCFTEDDSEEYYCDICEEERHPKDHIYFCEECPGLFVAHIECLLNNTEEEIAAKELLSNLAMDLKNTFVKLMQKWRNQQKSSRVGSKVLRQELMEQEETDKGNAESQNHDLDERQIQHFTHEHPLNYYLIIEKRENLLCKACNLEIYGEAYGCESCRYYLHKTCAKLSDEVQHPLHPQHPLILFPSSVPLLCLECRDTTVGFVYICVLCNFSLDVKCATLTTPNNESHRQKEMGKESKVCPFRQDHELVFLNTRHKPEENFRCRICFQLFSGPTYGCMRCKCFLHESCLGFPWEIQLPLIHPEHTLHPILIKNPFVFCLICGFPFPKDFIVYNCEQCQFLHLHLSCANSQRRALLFKAHKHPLFYFGTECLKLFTTLTHYFKTHISFNCNICNKPFSGDLFYGCLLCSLCFHLECILTPHPIKSKCHIHSLTLRDCFTEDDAGEYYCDICEEERHPKDHIYFCEECGGLFAAHIECVLNNMEEEIAAGKELLSNLALDFKNVFVHLMQQWRNQQKSNRISNEEN